VLATRQARAGELRARLARAHYPPAPHLPPLTTLRSRTADSLPRHPDVPRLTHLLGTALPQAGRRGYWRLPATAPHTFLAACVAIPLLRGTCLLFLITHPHCHASLPLWYTKAGYVEPPGAGWHKDALKRPRVRRHTPPHLPVCV